MTSQTKHYIELGDVIAFRFDCAKCGASLSVKLSDDRTKLPIGECPGCRRAWTSRPGLAVDVLIQGFRDQLKRIVEVMAQENADEPRFSMLVEVKSEPAAK